MEYIQHNPAEGIHYSAPNKPILFFTPAEIKKLSATPSRPGSLDMKNAFLFSCNTGLRKVDVQLIRFSQVGSIIGKGKFVPNPVSRFVQAKTKLEAHIILNDVSKRIVLDQWARTDRLGLSLEQRLDQHIFRTQFSTKLGHAFSEWLRDAGVPANERTFRHGRHSCATNLGAMGADLRDIQLTLGHSNPRYTASRYAGINTERLLERVSRLVEPPGKPKRKTQGKHRKT